MIYRGITVVIVLSASMLAATYKGKSVDGVSYGCTYKLKGEIQPCSVVFDGKRATLRTPKAIVEVRLLSEIIENPKEISGYLDDEPVTLNVNIPD